MFAILLAITSIPECHNSQFNQVDQYHIMLLLGHQRVRPTTSRKHLFNNMGCIIIKVTILLVKYASGFSLWVTPVDLCNIVYVFAPEAPSGFSPHSFFWRGVLAGRSEPNSVPLLLLFQGGRRCEPLKQQEETTGGRSDSHTERDKLGSCKILQEYKDIFNSPYCIQYSFIWMYYNLKCVHWYITKTCTVYSIAN